MCEDNDQVSRRQAITDVIESIAMEEKGIAAILKVEAKKIQKVIDCPCTETSEMISINNSVCHCLKNIIKLQMILELYIITLK